MKRSGSKPLANLRDQVCRSIYRDPDILSLFCTDLASAGLVHEERAAKLVYLVGISTLLPWQPASLAIKGPSSGGKNTVADAAFAFLPDAVVKRLTGMSEKALFYTEESLEHRVLYVAEGDGVSTAFLAHIIRSLISEGRLVYETVDRTNRKGMHGRTLAKDGPTAFLTTTTLPSLESQLETRLLSVAVDDSRAQTRAILRAQAAAAEKGVMNGSGPAFDYRRWHSFYYWLADGVRHVSIPFAGVVSDLMPEEAMATHMRRAFPAVITCISAIALLHRANRDLARGCIVATLDDYDGARELTNDLLTESVEQSVPATVRETVEAVDELSTEGSTRGLSDRIEPTAPSLSDLARKLNLDKSTVSRRVAVAEEHGYLRNGEERDGRPARLFTALSLPDDEIVVLPERAEVEHHSRDRPRNPRRLKAN